MEFSICADGRWPTDVMQKENVHRTRKGRDARISYGREVSTMDMTAVSAAMSVRQATTQQAVGVAVAKLSMDQQKQNGQQVMDLVKTASPAGRASLPHLGQNIDISV